jgi:hypothetical protein
MVTPWRSDPHLASLFLIEHPDDLQVLVHDGEPRRTQRKPEVCWVTVTGVSQVLRFPVAGPDAIPHTVEGAQWQERPVYAGTLLNAPAQLDSVKRGDTIQLIHTPGMPQPILVRPEYLSERPDWALVPCNRCGADQGLDAPTVMARTRFPAMPPDAVMEAFSAFCGCGGFMMLSKLARDPDSAFAPEAPPAPALKPWWRFW